MHEILDTHTSTTFLPSHVTTDYNPTTAQQTGIKNCYYVTYC